MSTERIIKIIVSCSTIKVNYLSTSSAKVILIYESAAILIINQSSKHLNCVYVYSQVLQGTVQSRRLDLLGTLSVLQNPSE